MILTLEMSFEGLETFVGWWRSRSSCTQFTSYSMSLVDEVKAEFRSMLLLYLKVSCRMGGAVVDLQQWSKWQGGW